LRLAEAAVLLAFAALFAHLALHAAVLDFGGGRLCGRHGRNCSAAGGAEQSAVGNYKLSSYLMDSGSGVSSS